MKTRIKNLFGAVLSLLALFGPANTALAQTPNRIVYSHQVSHQIYSMKPDGSDTQQLTIGGGAFPAWSYDQRYILFHRATSLEDTIYIMEARGERNGGRIFPVLSNAGNTGMDWSPDGHTIVFTVGSDGLWVMGVDPDSEELGTPILVRAGLCAAPVWSPDGMTLAFVSYPAGPTITLLDLASGAEIFVRSGYAPSFSPDGGRIAFRGTGAVTKGNKTTWHPQVFVGNVDGTGIMQLTRHTDYLNFPKWSPDGAQIAFWKQANGSDSIYKLTLATGATSLMKKGGNILDWAP